MHAHLHHRRPGQRGDRIEGDVAEQLDPDVVAKLRLDRALEAARDHRLAEREAPPGDRPVRLADREARPFDVTDDAGRLELGRAVDDAADRPLGRNRRRDRAAGIDRLDAPALVGPCEAMEVPPGDAVLRRDDGGLRAEQRLEQRPGSRIVVRLQAEHDDVDRADLPRVVGRRRVRGEVATRAQHPYAVTAHRLEIRAARDEAARRRRRERARRPRRRRSRPLRGRRSSRIDLLGQEPSLDLAGRALRDRVEERDRRRDLEGREPVGAVRRELLGGGLAAEHDGGRDLLAVLLVGRRRRRPPRRRPDARAGRPRPRAARSSRRRG